ncbi:MAG: hypothetical protein NC311_11340 [Muribaculaceae bacterium]|nr:hypothetical protein [Muribaculaceae bacterium]
MQITKEKGGFFSWIKNLREKIKKNQADSLNKKIEALRRRAYSHYLAIYIHDMEKNKKVDFPPFEYLSGRVVCPVAKIKADREIDAIVKQGPAKINKCYSILLKNIRREAIKNKKGY